MECFVLVSLENDQEVDRVRVSFMSIHKLQFLNSQVSFLHVLFRLGCEDSVLVPVQDGLPIGSYLVHLLVQLYHILDIQGSFYDPLEVLEQSLGGKARILSDRIAPTQVLVLL